MTENKTRENKDAGLDPGFSKWELMMHSELIFDFDEKCQTLNYHISEIISDNVLQSSAVTSLLKCPQSPSNI